MSSDDEQDVNPLGTGLARVPRPAGAPETDEQVRQRLSVLHRYAVYDIGIDPGFEQIARLAAIVCGTPYAGVGFIDDRQQWFPASFGVDIEPVPLDQSLCFLAIRNPGVTVSDDARSDPRFVERRCWEGGDEVVFYASAPIRSPEGIALGAICAFDSQPHAFSAAQADALGMLASQLMSQLELRRLALTDERRSLDVRRREHERDRFELALDIARLGDWQWHAAGTRQTLTLSQRAADIAGVPWLSGNERGLRALLRLMARRDRADLRRDVVHVLRSGGVVDREVRLTRPDGQRVWLLVRGRAATGLVTGRVGLSGVVQDVSDRHHTELRLRHSARRFETLAQLSGIAVRAGRIPPAELARQLLEHLAVVTGADGAGLLLRESADDAGGAVPVPALVQSTDAGGSAGVATLMREAIGERPVIAHDDVDESLPRSAAALKALGVRSVVAVQRPIDGGSMAVLELHAAQPRHWEADDVVLIELATERIASHVQRARLDHGLREGERRLRLVAEMIPQLAWMARPDGGVFWFNQRWYDYVGSDFARSAGSGWMQYVDPETRAQLAASFAQGFAPDSSAWDVVVRLRRADGAYRGHLARALPLKDDAGRNVLWFGTFTDLAEQLELARHRETMLGDERQMRAAAERASQLKDEFLATLSHELRTPLTAILGWAQVLARLGETQPVVRDGITAIERNARAQAQIIDDLLDLSRLADQSIRLELRRADPVDVVRAAVAAFEASAQARQVTLAIDAEPMPADACIDVARLGQILANLLSNAVKFTAAGGRVDVGVRRVDVDPDLPSPGPALVLFVRDTGQGIEPAFLSRLFERFTQADGSRARRHGGLGLGLALVQQLAALHGGYATARSAGAGHGAEFVVVLPWAPAGGVAAPVPDGPGSPGAADRDVAPGSGAAAGQDTAAGPGAAGVAASSRLPAGLRVLAVDDQQDTLSVLSRLLEERGATVVTCTTVDAAIGLLRRQQPGAAIQLVVTDIGMPVADGYELIRLIRASTDVAVRDVPVVALTAYGHTDEVGLMRDAGFDASVVKPFTPASLVDALLAACRARGASADGVSPAGASRGEVPPDGASPGGASPDGASPDGASPDGASPDGASSDGALPGGRSQAGASQPARGRG